MTAPQKGHRLGGRSKPPEPTSTRTDPPAPTAPEAPVEASANGSQPTRPVALPPPRVAAEAPVQMSAAEERRILHGVRAALGKVARDQASLRESEEMAAREVAEARASGIDERKLLGAALSAGVDLPAAE